MSTSLILTSGSWAGVGNTRARGQAYDASGRLLRAGELAALFDALSDAGGWCGTSSGLNGCFAAVRVEQGDVKAAVDRLRTFPLFFASSEGEFAIGDNADAVGSAALRGSRVDAVSASEFCLTGYVTGSGTLIDGLKQICAGQCLFRAASGDTEPRLESYYTFRHRSFYADEDDVLIDRLSGVHDRVFRRLVNDAAGRPIVVPLSGGYDSRLIGVMLRDLGYRDVLCYSYGVPGNWESRLSSELARYLGFRWTMVPYTGERWRRWQASPEFQNYFHAAGNYASIPHIQDWPAVFELNARGELPRESVFVPGHSGDFLAGSHIPRWYSTRKRIDRDEILQSIFDVHYSLWDWTTAGAGNFRSEFIDRIDEIIGPVIDASPDDAADMFECWDWSERQSKFIVNSVRVYEAFGYEWRLPLFDSELMDFWSRIPLAARVGRHLYFKFAAARQRLPVTPANTDHAAWVAASIGLVNRLGLHRLAKRAQRTLRRLRYRRQYSGSDMAWFALVDPVEFRRRYTGREIGHSFFALQYLAAIGADHGAHSPR
jgi:asparagine synthase (glutamine-hydrolysing)